jgi:hypothetical protein
VLPKDPSRDALDRASIVDEYGDLKRREKEFQPTKARLELLGKTIKSWYESEPADKEFVVETKKYSIKVSAREWKRTVDPVRLHKAVGLKRLLELVSVTLKALKDAGLEKLEILCVDTKQSGPRDLTLTPKAAVIPIAAGLKGKRVAQAAAALGEHFAEKEKAA